MGFPGSSAGKESACNAGDSASIPESGRSPWEGIGYSLQYSWGSLVAQTVKNLPAMRETWVRSLGWKDPLQEGMATTPVFLPGKSQWTEDPGRTPSMQLQESDTIERLSTAQCIYVNPNFLIHPTFPIPHCVHISILYICISIPALQIRSSVPIFLDSTCMQ